MELENNMPEGWDEATLGDVCENISRRFNFEQKESVVFVNTGDVLNGKFLHQKKISKEGLPGQAKKAIEYGDILYSEIRPANKRFALVDFDSKDYVVSTKFMVLKKNDKIDLDFFYLFLKSDKTIKAFQSHAEARSGTFPQITFDTISLDEILLPSLTEQKAIAKVLTAFDDKIELLQAQNKTLETMAQTIFKERFGKYQIGDELPEGWRVGEFGELFDLTMGLSPKGDSYNHDMKGVPLLNGAGDYTGEKLDPKRYTSKPTRINKVGDLVFCIRGTIGKIVFADTEYCLGRGVAALSPKESNDKYFNYIKLKRIIDELTRNATGSVILGLSKDDIKKAELILPSRIKLDEFSEIVKTLFNKIEINQNQLQSLTITRDTLLPKLMSGQVRVKNLKQTADA